VRIIDGSVPVTELIGIIKNSIKRAGVSEASVGSGLRVATVQLVLTVIAISELGGGIDIRVPVVGLRMKIGAKSIRRNTHILDITLQPPDKSPGQELRDGNVEDTLVDAVTTIRNVVAGAAEGDDPWLLAAGIVDISFVISESGTLVLGVEGEINSEVTQTLRLGLTRK
jgi:hypothetical protein